MPTLQWIGKEAVVGYADKVPFRVLEKKYTFGDDDANGRDVARRVPTSNKIIHGDNLEALKALLPEYEGRIKCIYIDPPYNTGNENWVYNDNVNSPRIRKWLGQVVGKEAEDLTRHDKWLCMMYPRLKMLQKLLSNDGAIFISIDDNEQANLKLICDEIFGAGNFGGTITRKQSSGAKNDTSDSQIISTTDYILCYKKGGFIFNPYQIKNQKKFTNKDEIGFFSTRALEMQGGGDTLPERPKMGYSVYYNTSTNDVKLLFDYNLNNNPVYQEPNENLILQGYECFRPRMRDSELGIWRWGDETFMKRFKENGVYFNKGRIFIKERATDFINKYPESLIDSFLNTMGTNELKIIFGERVFDFPKPSELLKFIFSIATDKDSIILDSFAGSGTTAHAVLNLNKADGGNRKFILVEMEDYAESITAERVKRVINGYGDTEGTGGSFDFYELGEPVFDDAKNLNENIGEEKIREYIWFSETHIGLQAARLSNADEPSAIQDRYFLGKYNNCGYWFFYQKETETTLDDDFLKTMAVECEQYVIYADKCILPKDFMNAKNIVFKKIPRDIKKL